MTSSQLPRGLNSLIPTSKASTPSERAAAHLRHLRQGSLPLPIIAAAAELIAGHLDAPDPADREVATIVHTHLLAALGDEAPGR